MSEDLERIQSQNLHIGSGVDDVVDPSTQTYLDEFGQYKVEYRSVEHSVLPRVALNSHKSRNEDDIAKTIFSKLPNMKYNDKLGYYQDLYVGHATTDSYRKNGSSGGLVSWVAVRLLEAGYIDGYIHVKKSKKSGILFEYGISTTTKGIKSGSKSRYYPAELSGVLKEVKKNPNKKYAVVGIPEIITELRLLAENDQDINSRIKYYFGLVCGHQKTTKYAEAIAWEYGIKPGDLEDIDFRVKKADGRASQYDMKFTGKVNNKSRSFTVDNIEPFVSSWAHGFFKARFSDFTDNTFNEVADVTFGDAWLEEYEADPMGNNILIVRNQDIATILKQGALNNEIILDAVDESTIIRSQQGLIHHTRDELPYRLYKEVKKYGWAPKKRVKPDNGLNKNRKKVQDIRQAIAEKSHIYYAEAVRRDDFDYFKQKMLPYVNQYKKLYHQPIARQTKKVKADGAILTLTGYQNYGNVIQRYALQEFLRKNGKKFISYVDPYSAPRDIYRITKKQSIKKPARFLKRYFNYQKPYWYTPKFGEIHAEAGRLENIIQFVNKYIWIKQFSPSDHFDTYIVGSDQVWRNWWNNRGVLGYYFLNFLKGKRSKRIAYAASFGIDAIPGAMSKEDAEYVKPYLESFDDISVREASGIDLIRNTWGVNGVEQVVDPTLLLSADDYSKIIDNSDFAYDDIQPIFAYIISETPEVNDYIHKIQAKRKQAVTKIRAHGGTENEILQPVERWLKGFRDADLVVTNSFHGMMFSILNNTDFIIIGRENGGLSRIRDFLSEYGLESRFVDEDNLARFDPTSLKQIDWQAVNLKLANRRKQSGDWLLSSINK